MLQSDRWCPVHQTSEREKKTMRSVQILISDDSDDVMYRDSPRHSKQYYLVKTKCHFAHYFAWQLCVSTKGIVRVVLSTASADFKVFELDYL